MRDPNETKIDPRDVVSEDTYLGALLQVNTIREMFGAGPLEELPPGYRMEGDTCPLANALSDVLPHVIVDLGIMWKDMRQTPHNTAWSPYEFHAFMTEFDG